eukprot:2742695-Lingulodinium_polyedra.AAC.1
MQLGDLNRPTCGTVGASRSARSCAHAAKPADRAADSLRGDWRAPGGTGGGKHAKVLEASARRDSSAARAEPSAQLGA